MKQKADAVFLHNNGQGRKITCQDNKISWINPDLTRTEREIRYPKRQKRRQKINKEKKYNDNTPKDLKHQAGSTADKISPNSLPVQPPTGPYTSNAKKD